MSDLVTKGLLGTPLGSVVRENEPLLLADTSQYKTWGS